MSMKSIVLKNRYQLRQSNDGFAAIVIALTLIIVLSLLTVGFAALIRREQTNALNKQLSSQAYYAAESGINDAIKALQNNQLPAPITRCSDLPQVGILSQASANSLDSDSQHSVKYTCVLVNTNPTDLFHEAVGNIDSEDSNVNSWNVVAKTNGVFLNYLVVNWSSHKGTRTAAPPNASGGFLPRTAWANNDYMGVLRFTIVPLNGDTNANHASLVSKAFTTYLYPTASSPMNSVAYQPNNYDANQGPITQALCSGGTCTARITGLNIPGPYVMHIESIYDSSDITLTGLSQSGAIVKFTNTQAIIDATGKAQNVLRRIQVRYSLQGDIPFPTDAIEAQDICKRIGTAPAPTVSQYFDYDGSPLPTSSNKPCNLQN